MSNRTKLGLNILEAALLLGLLGDALLRATPWGLNVLLFTLALVLAMAALQVRWGRVGWRGGDEGGGWLLLPVAFFAAAFAWRDSATLRWLDALSLCASFALLAWRAGGRSIRLAGLGDYALALGQAGWNALFASLPLLVTDVQWSAIPRGGVMRHVWAVARGLLIAVPLLFLFGALFMAADAVFEGIMLRTFQIDAEALFSHAFLLFLFAWLAGGFLRGMLLNGEAVSVSLDAVPAVYTSITLDEHQQQARTATGATAGTVSATPGSEPHERRQPQSVVDDATTASGSDHGNNEPANNGSEQSDRDPGGKQGNSSGGSGSVRVNGDRTDSGGVRSGIIGDARETAKAKTSLATNALTTARGFSLGAVEVGVVLGLLDVLFACFVAVQFRYFFGGAARVRSIAELTYAEYARHGFFELAWVSALVLPLLLITHALLRQSQPVALKLFRLLAGAQVALLFVIMASAVGRMRLYESEYGLTELRLYTTAFMFWLGLVFVWFAWTTLVRARRERFACGALVVAFVTVGLLHLLNPDAFIVRANTAHARAGRSFDAAYAASLSADAVPALISALPALSLEARCALARELPARREPSASGEDWRSWNISRALARRAVEASAPQLSLYADACPPPLASVPVAATPNSLETSVPGTSETGAPTNNAPAVSATNAATTDNTERTQTRTPGATMPAPNVAATMMLMHSADGNGTLPPAPQSERRRASGSANRKMATPTTTVARVKGRVKAR